MAYEKQVWNCGDTITADKMNHIEDGIENAGGGSTEPLILEEVSSSTRDNCTIYTYNATWEEVYQAFHAGRSIFVSVDGDTLPLATIQDNADMTQGGLNFLYAQITSATDVTFEAISLLPNETTGVIERRECDGNN